MSSRYLSSQDLALVSPASPLTRHIFSQLCLCWELMVISAYLVLQGGFAAMSHYLAEPGASNGPAEVCLMRELCFQEKRAWVGFTLYISPRHPEWGWRKSPFPPPALPIEGMCLYTVHGCVPYRHSSREYEDLRLLGTGQGYASLRKTGSLPTSRRDPLLEEFPCALSGPHLRTS